MAQVRAGSERAFEALFERHRRGVLAFCRDILGSTADAEDAVQHTFLAAYRDLMRSQKSIVLRPWLYGIARHRCMSVLRDRRERPVDELPEAGVDRLAADVATREDLRTTLADIGRLPDDQRAALILAEFGDVSHDEIARILGCHRDKVKALVFQARFSLRADRAARETPCADIRDQLVTLGGALRTRQLRRHVRDCEGCRAFRHQVRIQRRRVRVLVPVAPALALKRAAVGALSGWGGIGTGGAAVTTGALGGGVAVTALVAVAIAGGGSTGSGNADAGASEQARALATSETARYIESRGTVHAPRVKRGSVGQVRAGALADVRNAAGTETAERAEQSETSSHGVPRPGDGKAERGPAPESAAPGGAQQPTSDEGQATARSHAKGGNDHGREAPSQPPGPPGARGPGNSGHSPASNGGQNRRQSPPNRAQRPAQAPPANKPANPPQANGKDHPAPPQQHTNPPSGPPPDAGPTLSAPPQPSPAANPNPGGSGKPSGNDGGNSNGLHGAGNGPNGGGSGQNGAGKP